MAEGALEMLLDRLPPGVVDTFTDEQRAALWTAAKPTTWKRHPINIRLTFPFFTGHYFITVVGGVERRGKDRLKRERRMFPLKTAGNLLFLLGVGGAFYMAAVLGFMIFSKIVEF